MASKSAVDSPRDPLSAPSPASALNIAILDPGNFTPYYVDGLCRGLSQFGVRPRVITSPPLFEPTDTDGRYDVDWLFYPWLTAGRQRLLRRRHRLRQAIKAATYPEGLLRTWRTLRAQPPGVLHVQWALVPALDVMLLRALGRRGWRIVFTAHDPLPARDSAAAHRSQQALLASVDTVIVHTADLASQLAADYPDVASKITVVAHGGRTLPLPTASERVEARLSFGVELDDPVLLFFGMIKPYKGLEHLLEAMPKVLRAFPRARLMIAGESFIPLSTIEGRIERLGIAQSVRLRASFVPQREVSRYFAAADLLVAPHIEVAASGVVVTAQGYGVPVVTTEVGGLPELVRPDACGIVVPPGSADALADGICRALSDREALVAMGCRGRLRIAREGDWSNVARQTLRLYQDG